MRKKLITWLFYQSQTHYTRIFKSAVTPWSVTKQDLLAYPVPSLGSHLGVFLERNGFELIPKVEQHDVFHMLTGYGTKVEDEIALQYLCLGNGKRSLYLIGAITLGTLILPEYIHYYYQSYQKGRRANPFYHYDYQNLLQINFREFQCNLFCVCDGKGIQMRNLINARHL